MARMKDLDMSMSGTDREVADIDLHRLESRFDLLNMDILSYEEEEKLLGEIDAACEYRLARENHIKAHEESIKVILPFNVIKGLWVEITVAVIIMLFFSWAAFAQNLTVWCLVSDFNTQCIYYNLDSCQSSAEQLGGVCVPKQINEGE